MREKTTYRPFSRLYICFLVCIPLCNHPPLPQRIERLLAYDTYHSHFPKWMGDGQWYSVWPPPPPLAEFWELQCAPPRPAVIAFSNLWNIKTAFPQWWLYLKSCLWTSLYFIAESQAGIQSACRQVLLVMASLLNDRLWENLMKGSCWTCQSPVLQAVKFSAVGFWCLLRLSFNFRK